MSRYVSFHTFALFTFLYVSITRAGWGIMAVIGLLFLDYEMQLMISFI